MGEAKRRQLAVQTQALEAMVVDTPGGRIHVKWDHGASATPNAQLTFFSEFLATTGVYRTRADIPIRGGALASGFDHARMQDHTPMDGVGVISAEQVWDNYAYFIERVGPVAAEHGVKMGLHPDDPPVASIRGVGRIFGTVAGFDRALALLDTPTHGVTFCQATFGLIHDDVPALAKRWGQAGRIPFVHWRDVVGTAENFHEVFHDDGPTDMGALLKTYDDAGLDAFLRVDHVPAMEGEHVTNSALATSTAGSALAVGYETMGRLFAVGYLKGLLRGQGIPFE